MSQYSYVRYWLYNLLKVIFQLSCNFCIFHKNTLISIFVSYKIYVWNKVYWILYIVNLGCYPVCYLSFHNRTDHQFIAGLTHTDRQPYMLIVTGNFKLHSMNVLWEDTRKKSTLFQWEHSNSTNKISGKP